MIGRIIALIGIFLCTCFAWMILGTTIQVRTHKTAPALQSRVQSTWGGPLEQRGPIATVDGRKVEMERTRVEAAIRLEHRQKGLLWYSTYDTTFRGDYELVNPKDEEGELWFCFALPAKNAVYDDVQLQVNGKVMEGESSGEQMVVRVPIGAKARAAVRVGYRTRGMEQWKYRFGEGAGQVKDFQLRMTTDFADVDFSDNSLSPTAKKRMGKGWELEWSYRNLMSGVPIAVVMPEKLQPGPLAGQISYFAPVSLFFFFFVLFLITTLREMDLHPVNYFFLASAFFAFHLLLAYLVDHVSIHVAFAVSAAVSMGLVVSYLRIVTGERFAYREAALAQLVYLVLFSYAFFFEGYTGLAVTVGSIVTLFVAMQATARVNWSARF